MSEPHEVVKLLLARMESHPEEFRNGDVLLHDRWYEYVNGIQAYGNEADKAAIAAGLREIRLSEIHEKVMDELLNGDDRRRKAEEEREYERNLIMQKARNTYAQQNTCASQLGSYRNAAVTHIAGAGPSLKVVGTTGTGATLASSAINQIKKALGL